MAQTESTVFEKSSEIAVMRFAAARAKEIATLTEIIENPSSNKLIFQKLPCHMRRRAMSHNPNRMPRKLREAHKSQMEKGGKIVKPKRPRRKYRRRPSNLLEDYSRRSRKNAWLETHIWHAKRFHMIDKWGYRLPAESCSRSFRFCYRSTAQYCLLMDISYMNCIEIKGPQTKIVEGLKELTSPSLGLTFASEHLTKGNREGHCMMYSRNQYPFNAIGLVTFMWRFGDINPDDRVLWIWVHPAFKQQILLELQSVYSLSSELVNSETRIQLTLVDNLNRFRLRGPLSYQVAGSLLDPESFSDFIRGLLPPGFIMGATVRDPRVTLPSKRHQPQAQDDNSVQSTPSISSESSRSSLWDSDERNRVSKLRKDVPDHMINERRQKLLVPGTELPREPDECAIPLLFINAANEAERYVPGCDIILPGGWATAFWISLIYNGGRAGGLADADRMHFEFGICRDLHLEIDSQAGKSFRADRKNELMDAYFRKPPKCRSNFIKLATPFPFDIDWNHLIANWTDAVHTSFYVMRDRKLLRSISSGCPVSDSINTEPCLVPVTLTIRGHGNPQDFAMIFLPKDEDTKETNLVEPIHGDPGAKERKSLREQHQSELKRLAKKRKANGTKKEDYSSLPLVAQFRAKMRSLWLPTPCNLKTSFLRSVIGFVCQGDFGLSNGKGRARGYVLASAISLLKDKKTLVRNPAERCYMWAEIAVG